MKISNVKIIYIGESFYHYCINSISLTHSKSLKKVLNEEHYINVIQNIIPKQPASWLQCNKISVKWGIFAIWKIILSQIFRTLSGIGLTSKET